ncbi:hypothetical protein H7F51_02595 [Novosphingobium flavum]|uniref:Uncharacterized protein n=2 Tax=Novosphingobium flavum TaxID=1778672 RepID=A0A7X1FQ74_9SPHN|nr:hypothetical protein [Novosphingobium flavum]
MIARLPRLFTVRLLAALLLACVGLQAGAPLTAPLERTHGSAFSASTHEVALAGQRRAETVRIAPEVPPLVPVAVTLVAITVLALTGQPAPRPHSTGPPARDEIARRPSPRAPPLA